MEIIKHWLRWQSESRHMRGMSHDPVYEAAQQELETFRQKCREVEAFLVQYEQYRKQAAAVEPAAFVVPTMSSAPSKKASANDIMSAVHDILEVRGDALTLTAIFNQLTERGIRIGGSNPKQNLSQKLSAEPNLKSYGKRGWYFADAVPPCIQPRALSSGQNEEGPDSGAAEPLQSDGSEDQISRSTSGPSGRDMSLTAIVSSAPQHPEERGTAWPGKPSVDYRTPAN